MVSPLLTEVISPQMKLPDEVLIPLPFSSFNLTRGFLKNKSQGL